MIRKSDGQTLDKVKLMKINPYDQAIQESNARATKKLAKEALEDPILAQLLKNVGADSGNEGLLSFFLYS